MKKLAAPVLVLALLSTASLASAQAVASQNPYAWAPMFTLWGSQATTTNTSATASFQAQGQAQVQAQAGAASQSALQEFWSLMPMFSFFNFSR